MILPTGVKAFGISKVTIDAPDKVEVGSEFEVKVQMTFANLDKTSEDSLGVGQLSYYLHLDKDAFVIESIESEHWVHGAQALTEGIYSIQGVVDVEKPNKADLCINEVWNCSNYEVKLKLVAKNKVGTISPIKIDHINAYLYPQYFTGELKDVQKNYTFQLTPFKNIKITASSSGKVEVPAAPELTPLPTTPITPPTPVTPTTPTAPKKEQPVTGQKSDNRHLKSITINGQSLEIQPSREEYEVQIGENQNEIEVKVELEDSKATYEVVGANNLKENNNQVKINVTAENGQRKTYIIKTIQEEVKTEPLLELPNIKMDKKTIIIGCSIFIGLIVLILIIRKLRDRKVDKVLKDL